MSLTVWTAPNMIRVSKNHVFIRRKHGSLTLYNDFCIYGLLHKCISLFNLKADNFCVNVGTVGFFARKKQICMGKDMVYSHFDQTVYKQIEEATILKYQQLITFINEIRKKNDYRFVVKNGLLGRKMLGSVPLQSLTIKLEYTTK